MLCNYRTSELRLITFQMLESSTWNYMVAYHISQCSCRCYYLKHQNSPRILIRICILTKSSGNLYALCNLINPAFEWIEVHIIEKHSHLLVWQRLSEVNTVVLASLHSVPLGVSSLLLCPFSPELWDHADI